MAKWSTVYNDTLLFRKSYFLELVRWLFCCLVFVPRCLSFPKHFCFQCHWCQRFVPVTSTECGRAAHASVWTPRFWASNTWPGWKDGAAISLRAEVCLFLKLHHVQLMLKVSSWTSASASCFISTCHMCLDLLVDDGAVVMEVDHEKQVVYTEPLVLSPRDAPSLLAAMQPSQENTAQRLTSPIVSTHLNTRNIAFER